jgi:hypothetical protein
MNDVFPKFIPSDLHLGDPKELTMVSVSLTLLCRSRSGQKNKEGDETNFKSAETLTLTLR